MKAFEKWLNEDSVKTGLLYDEVAEKERKKGWRGAFEKINSWLRFVSGQVADEVKAQIKKELEEE